MVLQEGSSHDERENEHDHDHHSDGFHARLVGIPACDLNDSAHGRTDMTQPVTGQMSVASMRP